MFFFSYARYTPKYNVISDVLLGVLNTDRITRVVGLLVTGWTFLKKSASSFCQAPQSGACELTCTLIDMLFERKHGANKMLQQRFEIRRTFGAASEIREYTRSCIYFCFFFSSGNFFIGADSFLRKWGKNYVKKIP